MTVALERTAPAEVLTRVEDAATTDAALTLAATAAAPADTGAAAVIPVAAGTVRPGPDGYLVTGRWPGPPGAPGAPGEPGAAGAAGEPGEPDAAGMPAASGRNAVAAELLHADGSRVGGPLLPELRLVLLPAGDLSCSDLAVPADDVLDAFSACPAVLSALGPPIPVAYRLGIVAVAVGIARRAFVEFVAAARHRSRLGAVSRMAEQPLLQVELNRAVLDLRAARELVAAEVRRLPTDGVMSRADRVRAAAACLHAHRVARDCVRFAFGRAGASSLYSGHPLEGLWRRSEELSRAPLFDARAERAVAAAQMGWHVPGNQV